MVEYTANQTGAIATMLSSAVSSSTILGLTLADTYPIAETFFFSVITLTFWILVPLYWRKIRWSYVIGFLCCVIALTIGAVAIITDVESIWQTFSGAVFNFSLTLIWTINLACAYFSYRSSKETKVISN
jgi:hypothetical protein